MNANQILNMILRIFMRKAINGGINAGIKQASKVGRRQQMPPPDGSDMPQKSTTPERDRIRAERRARRAARENAES